MFKSRKRQVIHNSKNTLSSDSCDNNDYANSLHYNVNRYYMHYQKHISCDLIYKHNIKNIFTIPKIQKIVLNATHKTIVNNRKNIIPFLASLQIISCQKLKITNARKNISFFKIRKNQTIGCKIDLRRKKMFEFLEKLTYIVLPMTNFLGINNNWLNTHTHFVFSVGLKDILIFPELQNYFEYFNDVNGFNISIIIKNSSIKNTKNIKKLKKKPASFSHNLCATHPGGIVDLDSNAGVPYPGMKHFRKYSTKHESTGKHILHIDTKKLENFKMSNFLSAFQIPNI